MTSSSRGRGSLREQRRPSGRGDPGPGALPWIVSPRRTPVRLDRNDDELKRCEMSGHLSFDLPLAGRSKNARRFSRGGLEPRVRHPHPKICFAELAEFSTSPQGRGWRLAKSPSLREGQSAKRSGRASLPAIDCVIPPPTPPRGRGAVKARVRHPHPKIRFAALAEFSTSPQGGGWRLAKSPSLREGQSAKRSGRASSGDLLFTSPLEGEVGAALAATGGGCTAGVTDPDKSLTSSTALPNPPPQGGRGFGAAGGDAP